MGDLGIILALLVGAAILGVGVWAGSWLRAAATDPAILQVRATNRELMAWRKEAQTAMAKVISTQAEIINDRSTAPDTRWKLEEAQRWIIETTERTERTESERDR